MAAKTWELDFRYPAITASIRRIRAAGVADPFEYPGSFCVPVAKKPAVGWTPGRVTLIFLVAGFALLGCGAALAYLAEKADGGAGTALLAGGVCCSLSGMLLFFVPAKFDRQLIRFLIGDRASHLFDGTRVGKLASSELSNADRKKITISIDGDDHVLILADAVNRQLLIEGTGARYRVRAEDVVALEPFSILNYVGAEIRCRVAEDVDMHFALARVSLLLELTRQVPILFFLRKRIKNPLFELCQTTLQG